MSVLVDINLIRSEILPPRLLKYHPGSNFQKKILIILNPTPTTFFKIYKEVEWSGNQHCTLNFREQDEGIDFRFNFVFNKCYL